MKTVGNAIRIAKDFGSLTYVSIEIGRTTPLEELLQIEKWAIETINTVRDGFLDSAENVAPAMRTIGASVRVNRNFACSTSVTIELSNSTTLEDLLKIQDWVIKSIDVIKNGFSDDKELPKPKIMGIVPMIPISNVTVKKPDDGDAAIGYGFVADGDISDNPEEEYALLKKEMPHAIQIDSVLEGALAVVPDVFKDNKAFLEILKNLSLDPEERYTFKACLHCSKTFITNKKVTGFETCQDCRKPLERINNYKVNVRFSCSSCGHRRTIPVSPIVSVIPCKECSTPNELLWNPHKRDFSVMDLAEKDAVLVWDILADRIDTKAEGKLEPQKAFSNNAKIKLLASTESLGDDSVNLTIAEDIQETHPHDFSLEAAPLYFPSGESKIGKSWSMPDLCFLAYFLTDFNAAEAAMALGRTEASVLSKFAELKRSGKLVNYKRLHETGGALFEGILPSNEENAE